MFQIFAMQLQQILAGQRKWLVLVFVALPVLLTWVTMDVGGLGEHKRRMEERAAQGDAAVPPERIGARQIVATDEPISLHNDLLVIYPDRILYQGNPIREGEFIDVGEGWIQVIDGEVWLNESRRPTRNRVSIHRNRHGRRFDFSQIPWDLICGVYLFLLYPQMICLLLALFYGCSILGSELENKTLTYLLTRPLPRWKLVGGKYLAVVAVLIPPTAVSLWASWQLLGAPGDGLFTGMLAGSVGGLLAYNAIFCLLGFLAPKRAMVFALIYGVVFEFVLSFVPAIVNQFTVTYYLRSMVRPMVVSNKELELPRELERILGGASLSTAVLTLLGMVAGSLLLSSILAARREYVIADQA